MKVLFNSARQTLRSPHSPKHAAGAIQLNSDLTTSSRVNGRMVLNNPKAPKTSPDKPSSKIISFSHPLIQHLRDDEKSLGSNIDAIEEAFRAYEERFSEIARENKLLKKANDKGSSLIGKCFRTIRQLTEFIQAIREISVTDPLTELPNRRGLYQNFEQILQRAFYEEKDIILSVGDIDFFKQVNANYGYSFGDKILSDVAKLLKYCAGSIKIKKQGFLAGQSSVSLAGRLGGEEFVLFSSGEEEHCLTSEVMNALEDENIEHLHTQVPDLQRITMSFGAVRLSCNFLLEFEKYIRKSTNPFNQCENRLILFETLLSCANTALAQAKNAGRNKAIEVCMIPGNLSENGNDVEKWLQSATAELIESGKYPSIAFEMMQRKKLSQIYPSWKTESH